MNDSWRAFVGQWDEQDGRFVDEKDLTWGQAQRRLLTELEAFENDDCPDCVGNACVVAKSLLAAAHGKPWCDELEGEDYVIAEQKHP